MQFLGAEVIDYWLLSISGILNTSFFWNLSDLYIDFAVILLPLGCRCQEALVSCRGSNDSFICKSFAVRASLGSEVQVWADAVRCRACLVEQRCSHGAGSW